MRYTLLFYNGSKSYDENAVNLYALVATHADHDLETVARLSAGATAVAGRGVVLVTCNRFEIYAVAEDPAAHRAETTSLIASASGLSPTMVRRALRPLDVSEASEHLFSVASGLDSAVVGEREIAGQVRRALSKAQSTYADNGWTLPGALVRLFQAASKTAKQVGSQTSLGSQGRSIVSVALDLAADSFPLAGSVSNPALRKAAEMSATEARKAHWQQVHAVVFGTGAYAGVTMALLRERGVQDISVYSSSGRAAEFVAHRGGTAVASLSEALGKADLVVGCSGSDRRIAASALAAIRQEAGTAQQPLTVIDLALSRDFDPAVAELPCVELLNLESVRLAAPAEQESALAQARSIVQEAAKEFRAADAARRVSSAIIALRKHTLATLDSELERVRAHHGCTAAAEEVEFALRRMVRQLLHTPTVRARELAAEGRQDEYVAALATLYGVTPADNDAGWDSPLRAADECTVDLKTSRDRSHLAS